jgi:cytochrome c oxidase subunit 2
MKGTLQSGAFMLACLPIAGCTGVQSALNASGAEASRIQLLAIVLTIFCTLVFIGTGIIAALALFGNEGWRRRLSGEALVVNAGLIFPAAALALLLFYGLVLIGMGGSAANAGDGDFRITVTGKRWWWQVAYATAGGRTIASANELRIPAGRPVKVTLVSDNVIHSFWVPRLAGKLDMIPGRVNTLTLHAEEAGISRGQCAEYCGGAHALMSFFVIALAEDEFSAWLANEAAPAREPEGGAAMRGRDLFVQSGCGGCHTVRGTQAVGAIGPDLTHVGSRHSLGAATLPNDAASFARWIRDNQHIKPENLMPAFDIFDEAQLSDLSAYLEQLR